MFLANIELYLLEKYGKIENGLYFLTLKDHDNIQWFGSIVLKKFTTYKEWKSLQENLKKKIKETIFQFLAQNYQVRLLY